MRSLHKDSLYREEGDKLIIRVSADLRGNPIESDEALKGQSIALATFDSAGFFLDDFVLEGDVEGTLAFDCENSPTKLLLNVTGVNVPEPAACAAVLGQYKLQKERMENALLKPGRSFRPTLR